uniref:Abhydrolase_3 domain-containing protein n=1 Tax=Parastrongyloides trichosuri TaxID=131310 RepID=A0A0N4ZTB7_PARTI
MVFIPQVPKNICNRNVVSVMEFFIRLGNEYMGDVAEIIGGAKVRNEWIRFLASSFIVFQVTQPFKKHLTITRAKFGGTQCRIYTPINEYRRSNACIIYIHGGAWCILKAHHFDYIISTLVKNCGCTIISINYSLAPDKIFPTSFNECWNAIEDICEFSYNKLLIDKNKIAIFGDSAGGNIAAALALKSSKTGKNYFKCQILVYPVISCLDFQNSSYKQYYEEYNGTGLLNPEGMARWMLLYLGIPASKSNVNKVLNNQHISDQLKKDFDLKIECLNGCDERLSQKFEKFARNPAFCPLLSKDIHLLPKTLIITSGFDICRDEGIDYYKKMKECGVDAELKHFPTTFHGILNLAGSSMQKSVKGKIVDYCKKHLL